jgi:hypothetical protein
MDLSKLFLLKRPCANCPFLKVGAIELRPGRVAGIIAGLIADDESVFHCHKTTHHYDDEYEPCGTESYCAGALIYLYKAGHPNVAMRLGQALGMFDPQALADSFDDVIDHARSLYDGTT